jgi:hypothetical protein
MTKIEERQNGYMRKDGQKSFSEKRQSLEIEKMAKGAAEQNTYGERE